MNKTQEAALDELLKKLFPAHTHYIVSDTREDGYERDTIIVTGVAYTDFMTVEFVMPVHIPTYPYNMRLT